MMRWKLLSIVAFGVLLLTLAFTASAQAPEGMDLEIPFVDEWSTSGHADAESESFRHWDEEDPPEVPVACAKCHSATGFLDFVGADDSEVGVVNAPAPTDTVIDCVTCHNPAAMALDSVAMPSGVVLTGLADEARCMQCHQGRASTQSVLDSITKAGVEDEDTPSADLGFTNIHYYAAAATMYGTMAMGGYQYTGKTYDAKFEHVEDFDSCIECHDPHTLQVRLESCAACHTEAATVEGLRDIRTPGSVIDYDGDGDVAEGIYHEIEGLRNTLYDLMQVYAAEVAGTPLVYDSHSYPYFFIDTNADGEASEDEAQFPNSYNAWTARLAKAAYNYQTSLKDPGAYAHGGKYIIQLLYDSIEDINTALGDKGIDVAGLRRIDAGHFAGSEEAFRHWDGEGVVPASCVKCHTAEGLPFFLQEGVNVSAPPSNGLTCVTCHDSLTDFTIYQIETVKFPSGAQIASGDPATNVCMQCHQGRESTYSIRDLTRDLDADSTSEKLRFLNVHYFAAGATRFGTQAKGAYEYEDKEYNGFFAHPEPFVNCTQCHETHGLTVKEKDCAMCHAGVEEEGLESIRMKTTDYDGDGDTSEGVKDEIATMHQALYTALQAYASEVVGTPIVYSAQNYPYFFVDVDGDGVAGPDEAAFPNSYATWTPRLLRAAYNYQYVAKDPGVFAHNPGYIMQVLYDALEDLADKVAVDMEGMVRPEVIVP